MSALHMHEKPGVTGPGLEAELTYDIRRSGWGWVGAVGTEEALAMLTLPRAEPGLILEDIGARFGELAYDGGRFGSLFDDLEDYFTGQKVHFSVRILRQGTAFQWEVWSLLRTIPYGETRTYGELGALVGRARGARAIGQAVGANPVGIVIPCHRVIAANGKIGGFGGGLELKQRLLSLEGIRLGPRE